MVITDHQNNLELAFHHFGFFINFSWNIGDNFSCVGSVSFSFTYELIYVCVLYPLLFPVPALPEERSIFWMWFSCTGSLGIIGTYFMDDVGIPIVNVTTMLFFSFLCIKQRSSLWSSMIPISLTVIILWRLMKRPLLFSTIILGGTCCFKWTPIAYWIIFERAVWLTLYKQTKTFCNTNIFINMSHAWKHSDLTYYLPLCGITMYLPIVDFLYWLKALFQQFLFHHCQQVILY